MSLAALAEAMPFRLALRGRSSLVVAFVNDLIATHDDLVETVPDSHRCERRFEAAADRIPVLASSGHV